MNIRGNRFQHVPQSRVRTAGLVFGLLFAVVGIAAMLSTRAATPTTAVEAEAGTRTSNVNVVANGSASAGSYVQFSSGSPATSWRPLTPGTAWQWQLTGTVNETVLDNVSNPKKMYDIDMFNASTTLISRLKAKGIYVVCYIEAGDWAGGRPDASDFASSILSSNTIDGFPDERYINVTQLDSPAGPTGKTLRQIMTARLQMARDKGCDGIEPDLDDLHTYPTRPFKITQAQQVAYNTFLIQTGHSMGMSVGLKNGPDPDGTFNTDMYNAGADWVVNEECNQYSECGGYDIFVRGNRAVFQVEYLDNQSRPYNTTCSANNAAGFDGIVKDSSSVLAALPRIACKTGN